jgi:hypothetical protein
MTIQMKAIDLESEIFPDVLLHNTSYEMNERVWKHFYTPAAVSTSEHFNKLVTHTSLRLLGS